ncbi:MAG: PQQ-binding-like beta-propeller repeat protein [Planctomycetes bacterium]|nr:PQQ-binding-like beta-propeller repeat protein [Planctomycetota bacterium]
MWAEREVLETLPPEGLKLRWRHPVARGFSSPVVAGGRVYVTDAELLEPRVRESFFCLDAESGAVLWRHSADADYPEWIFLPDQRRGPGSTPIVHGGKVHALGGFGHLVCLDAAKGELIWERDLRHEHKLRDLPLDASPLIEGDRLIVFIGGRPGAAVVAFDRATGRELWRALDESSTHSSPVVIGAGGARQLILWTQESVVSLDPANGAVLWREPLPTSADHAVATPVFQEGRLLVAGLMFGLEAARPAATVAWPQTRAVARRVLSNTSTALILEGHVYSARSPGTFVALDATSGEQVWETDAVTDLKTGASIHVTRNGGSAVLFTDKGELIRERLSPGGYEERGRVRLIEPTWPFAGRNVAWAAPAFANRCVFARNDEEVLCASLAARR